MLFRIDGINNIPAHIICSGHGYGFDTYCCRHCGELYVVDLEALYWKNVGIAQLAKNKLCQNCQRDLESSLLKYPENIVFKGAVLNNENPIDYSNFDDAYFLEVYYLS